MNRQQLNALDKLLRDRSGSAKLNKALLQLHQHYEFGRIDPIRKCLTYRPEELARLEAEWRHALQTIELRQLSDQLKQTDRAGAARLTSHEKLARDDPGEHLVQLTWGNGRLQGKAQPLPESATLQLDWRRLPAFDRIILVENWDTFLQLERYSLPPELTVLPALYRGHDRQARNLKRYLMAHDHCQVMLFADLDAKGLLLAQEFGACGFIAPNAACWSQAINASASWDKQRNLHAQLNALPNGPLHALWQQLQAEQLAIMQQQWAAHDLPLICHPL
ncbi:DUF7281 domain-containing protein [Ferrimonas pelagia]|uniref:DUF7281 domain-containing protein n=1 Tax=Ferrimonas pelagia TaxID=1177826 RepID=A0ABP9F4A6_9GAMM